MQRPGGLTGIRKEELILDACTALLGMQIPKCSFVNV
jgi:hypothetical protein